MDFRRCRQKNSQSYQRGPLMYWMNRDMRLQDNWALLATATMAKELGVPFGVLYSLDPSFLGGGFRQLSFKISALRELEQALSARSIPFFLALGNSLAEETVRVVQEQGCGAIITDFSPLHVQQAWLSTLVSKVQVPIFEVDAHNVVPAWIASPKLEFAAYTLRPKLHQLLPDFLTEFDPLPTQTLAWGGTVPSIDWNAILSTSVVRRDITETGFAGGETAAHKALARFLTDRLPSYHTMRNDPTKEGQSDLSPYLHYGNLSAQRVALAVQKSSAPEEAKASFLEELIVRRELSDNFCLYNPAYDSTASFHVWAKTTLDAHRGDVRTFVYTQEEFEHAKTHDPLWNAAQQEMVWTGKMHGYLRMYWAKKLLEWTASPEDALAIGIYLNDTYSLDGRDPNGYAGLAWSIGGVHDRAWGERPIFGKIRYMNDAGCKRKFDVPAYIARVNRMVRDLQK